MNPKDYGTIDGMLALGQGDVLVIIIGVVSVAALVIAVFLALRGRSATEDESDTWNDSSFSAPASAPPPVTPTFGSANFYSSSPPSPAPAPAVVQPFPAPTPPVVQPFPSPVPTPAAAQPPPPSVPTPAAVQPSSSRAIVPVSDAPLFSEQNYAVNLIYGDYCGDVTTRVVDVDSAWWNGDQCYFRGWCRLREDWRTFRVDRVVEAWVDGMPQRGDGWALIAYLCEVSPPPTVVPGAPAATARAPAKPKRPAPKVKPPTTRNRLGSVDVQAGSLDQLTAMVHVLVYLARADGRFEAKEKESIRPLLASWSRGLGSVPPHLGDLAKIQVNHNAFRAALAVLIDASPEIKVAVLTGAVQVAEASAGVKEDEAAVLRQIEAGLHNRMALHSHPKV